MKFIIIASIIALITFSSLVKVTNSEMACRIYTNQTVLGGLCPTPNYKIAPLLDYINESRTDDVSKDIVKYYNGFSSFD